MLFNSFNFVLLFLPSTVVAFYLVSRYGNHSQAKFLLIAASLFFYAYWKYQYLLLIVLSLLCNYGCCVLIVNYPLYRRLLFYSGILGNIGLLSYFKYRDFFLFNINYLTGSEFSYLYLVLPLGISFFTIQQITFLVDVYQGVATKPRLLSYTLFVTFFPQLIAGPIVRHDETIPQFEKDETFVINFGNLSLGLFCFFLGLFKKVVLGDTFGLIATNGFADPSILGTIDAWVSSLAYTFQLYFDFSGYSDMAYGLALMFNIRLPVNFFTPYRSTNLVEFWQNWHITLSRFITIYLYTPLVRIFGQTSFPKAMFATVLAMLIAGVWHGAGWNFVIFGALHGFGLVCNQIWKRKRINLSRALGWFLTFNYVNLTFVFFRADTTESALQMLQNMFFVTNPFHLSLMDNLTFSDKLIHSCVMLVAIPLAIFGKNSHQLLEWYQPNRTTVFFTTLLIVICFFYMNSVIPREFLYFDF